MLRRRLRPMAPLVVLLGLLIAVPAQAAEPPNQNDPCSKAGRNTCGTNGVGEYRNYRYGIRWFGDYRKAVDGVDDATFCVDLRFWYPSKAFGYERRSAAGLNNKDGEAVSTTDLRRMAYALWANDRSAKSKTEQAATMLYVHGLMGDAAPGEAAPDAIGPTVERRVKAIAAAAAKYAGPYTVEVSATGGLVVGTPATVTARVLSASGAAMPGVRVKLDGKGAEGLPKTVTTGDDGAGASAPFTPTTAAAVEITAEASVSATLPALYVPTKGEARRSGQRLVGPATVTASNGVTATAKVAPKVSTQISAQSTAPGSQITDSVKVEGLSGQAVTVNAALYGPFPAADRMSCDKDPVWTGTVAAPTDGTYATEPVTLTTPGYYTYVEWIDETDRVAATRTTCGDAAETTVVRGDPKVTTQVSAAETAPGTPLTDSVVVTGLGVLSATINVELWGPFPTKEAVVCEGTPAWTGTVAANGDGTYATAPFTLPAAGYYTYRESLAETPAYPGHTSVCGEATETTFAKAAPKVTTIVSDAVLKPGGSLNDTLKVTGLGKTAATIDVRLYGPYATRDDMTCKGTPYWRGKVQAPGDGTYASAKTVLKRTGFYVYVESIAGSASVTATKPVCGVEAETALSAPQILTGRSEIRVHPAPRVSAAQDKRVTPTSVTIARYGVRAPVTGADIDLKDGTLGVPANIKRVGWWRDGAAPGDARGTILLAGHVDSAKSGAGAFYALPRVRAGDTITVGSDDGKTRRYRVTSTRRMRKAQLPSSIFTRTGAKRLVLVTCGGSFDTRTGHYRDNIVVTARAL